MLTLEEYFGLIEGIKADAYFVAFNQLMFLCPLSKMVL